jgi:F420-non-reducing hydrogenase small subunit
VANKEQIFHRKYVTAPTVDNDATVFPREKIAVHDTVTVDGVGMARTYELDLPSFYDTVKTLDQVIDVDYYLPGCPPPSNLVWDAVIAILQGQLPEKGAVLAPNKALCDSCPRAESKPDEFAIGTFKRVATSTPDPEECFLAQGYICLGPATRSGCGERCINGNMPCRGCFGPPDGVVDQGTKILSAIASVIDCDEAVDVEGRIGDVADPLGTFYRFSLPASLLGRVKMGG